MTRRGERPAQKRSLLRITCSLFVRCLCKPWWVTWIWDIIWRCKLTNFYWWKWPKDANYGSVMQITSPVHPALKNCKQISTFFRYYIQGVTVFQSLENTNSLSSNIPSMCSLPVPSMFLKNYLLWISNHCKVPPSSTQLTLLSNIYAVRCRSIYVLVSLWISLCHATWDLHFFQHKLVQIASATQILVIYIQPNQ